MVDFIVDILNAISSGISQSQVDDLLKTPAAYNSSMYNLSLSIAQTAVKPVASMVLAIVFTLELARVSSKVDENRELGVKMVVSAMIRIMLVFTAAWGWMRPKGLKPEAYAVYVWRHYTQREIYLLDGPARPARAPAKPTVKER